MNRISNYTLNGKPAYTETRQGEVVTEMSHALDGTAFLLTTQSARLYTVPMFETHSRFLARLDAGEVLWLIIESKEPLRYGHTAKATLSTKDGNHQAQIKVTRYQNEDIYA